MNRGILAALLALAMMPAALADEAAGDGVGLCERFGTPLCARRPLPGYIGPWIPAGRRLTYASGRPETGAVAEIGGLGLRVSEITAALASRHRVSQSVSGVVVVALDPAGAGARQGLEAGDVLVELDQRPIADPQALLAELARLQAAGVDTALLLLYRDYRELFTVVALP